MVRHVEILGAAREGSWGGVHDLLGDDPLLAVALGSALSDATKVAVVRLLHAIPGPVGLDAKIRRAGVGLALLAAIACAELAARWEALGRCLRSCWGLTTVVLHRHVLGLQSLATLVDLTVALDKNLGLDISSVGDLASASGTIDPAGAVLVDLHAGLLAIIVDSALGVASHVATTGRGIVASSSNVLVAAAEHVGLLHFGFKFFNGLFFDFS